MSDAIVSFFPSGRALLIAFGAGLLIAAGFTFLGEMMLHVLACVFGAGVAGFILLLIAIHSVVTQRNWRRMLAPIVGAIVLSATLALTQCLGIVAGVFVDAHRSRVARAWCDSLKPSLETWHAEHGAYPAELTALGLELDPPLYCRRSLLYRGTADGYRLDFFDSGWLSGWEYSSASGEWAHYD